MQVLTLELEEKVNLDGNKPFFLFKIHTTFGGVMALRFNSFDSARNSKSGLVRIKWGEWSPANDEFEQRKKKKNGCSWSLINHELM